MSRDGKTWDNLKTEGEDGHNDYLLRGSCIGKGMLVAVGGSEKGRIMISRDGGAEWELRTPLAALQLAMQSLQLQLAKPRLDPQTLQGRAAAGERQIARMARLIDDLLDVSIIRAGRMQLEREPMDLVDAAKIALSRFREELQGRNVHVAVYAPEPVVGSWDPRRIDQVITNLLSNALKCGEGRPVRMVIRAEEGKARLSVEDQGLGMTEDTMQRIFRPFERGVAPGHYGVSDWASTSPTKSCRPMVGLCS